MKINHLHKPVVAVPAQHEFTVGAGGKFTPLGLPDASWGRKVLLYLAY